MSAVFASKVYCDLMVAATNKAIAAMSVYQQPTREQIRNVLVDYAREHASAINAAGGVMAFMESGVRG